MDRDKVYNLIASELGKQGLREGDRTLSFSPASEQKVSPLLALCSARGISVRPRGEGAWCGVTEADPPDLFLELGLLRGVVDHDRLDLCATVKCGTTIFELNRALSAKRQWVAVDPPRKKVTSVGGMVALDLGGPRRLSCGETRDQLLGLRLVLGDGREIRAGGRAVKNVSGYDLTHAFAGSQGRWGVLLEATFKLRPLAESRAVFFRKDRKAAELLSLAAGIASSPLAPQAMVLLNWRRAASLPFAVGRGEWVLVCEVAGTRASLGKRAAELNGLAGGVEEVGEVVWEEIEDFPVLNGGGSVFKFLVSPSRLGRAAALLEGAGLELHVDPVGGLVIGAGEVERCRELDVMLARLAAEAGGAYQWLWPARPRPLGRIEKELCQLFDPKGILSPRTTNDKRRDHG